MLIFWSPDLERMLIWQKNFLWKSAILHSINLPFDAQVAAKILNIIYCLLYCSKFNKILAREWYLRSGRWHVKKMSCAFLKKKNKIYLFKYSSAIKKCPVYHSLTIFIFLIMFIFFGTRESFTFSSLRTDNKILFWSNFCRCWLDLVNLVIRKSSPECYESILNGRMMVPKGHDHHGTFHLCC